jgi:hypothetical protein
MNPKKFIKNVDRVPGGKTSLTWRTDIYFDTNVASLEGRTV